MVRRPARARGRATRSNEWFIAGTQPGRRGAVDEDGLLYRAACGGWRVDPVKAELGPSRVARRRRGLAARGPGVAPASAAGTTRARRTSGASVVGRAAGRRVLPAQAEAQARATEGPANGPTRPAAWPARWRRWRRRRMAAARSRHLATAVDRRLQRRTVGARTAPDGPGPHPPPVEPSRNPGRPHGCAPRCAPGSSGGWASRSAILVIVGLVLLGVAAGGVLLLLFIAVLLASALEPGIGTVRGRLPLGVARRSSSSTSGSSSSSSAWPSSSCRPRSRQAEDLIAALPPFFEQARAWAGDLRPAALVGRSAALVEAVAQILKPPPPPDPDTVVEVGTVVAEATVAVATLLTIVYFWLVEHARLQRYVLAFLPARAPGRRARRVERDRDAGSACGSAGQLILMGAMGVATAITYTLLGLPGALLLGLIAALTEAIPIVGPLLGAIPAVLVAATVSPELAVVVAVVYVVLQFLEGSVLVPLVMRNTVGISPLLVLVSLLIGAAVGGLVGAFLAVPVAAAIEIDPVPTAGPRDTGGAGPGGHRQPIGRRPRGDHDPAPRLDRCGRGDGLTRDDRNERPATARPVRGRRGAHARRLARCRGDPAPDRRPCRARHRRLVCGRPARRRRRAGVGRGRASRPGRCADWSPSFGASTRPTPPRPSVPIAWPARDGR